MALLFFKIDILFLNNERILLLNEESFLFSSEIKILVMLFEFVFDITKTS